MSDSFVFFRLMYDTGMKLQDPMMRLQYFEAICKYGLDGTLPEDPVMKALINGAVFSIDKHNNRCEKISESMKGNSNACKTWEKVSKQMKTDENRGEQIKQFSSGSKEDRRVEENKNKNIYPPDFESFWKEFPHARKGKKGEAYSYYSHLDPPSVLLEARHLKLKVMAGVQDSQFIPACERWMRDFTPTSDEVKVQDLERIMRWHLTTEGAKDRYPLLVSVYGESRVKAMAKKLNSILDLDGPKNVQV